MPKQKGIYIPFDELAEGRNWKIGQIYRIKAVLRQVGADEDGATYQIVDATSLERDGKRRFFNSDGGSYGGK